MENPTKPDESEWIESNSFLSSLSVYDENGNVIKTVSYSQQGSVQEFYEYKFGENNNLVEEICYYDETEIAEHKYIFWDEDRKISEKISYQEGGENIVILSYDHENNLIERRVVDQDNELQEKEIYEWENKNIISEKMFDDEKLIFQKNYSYNELGLLAEYEYSSPEHADKSRVTYFYNENQNREKILRYNWKDQLIHKTIFTEDENGNVIEIDEEDQKSKKITRLFYDDRGNTIKQEEYNEEDVLIVNIERTYNTEGSLLETLVYSQNPEDDVREMYATKYDYEFFDKV